MNDVKIVPGTGEVSYLDVERKRRTEAQRAQDEILDKATENAEKALEHANEALDWLAVITQPKTRNVSVYVNQLVEEIAEVRRVRQ